MDPDQKFMVSVLAWDPSAIQDLWKSVQWFLCNPADKPTNQPTNQQTNEHRLKYNLLVVIFVYNCDSLIFSEIVTLKGKTYSIASVFWLSPQ